LIEIHLGGNVIMAAKKMRSDMIKKGFDRAPHRSLLQQPE
jgi:hypothetical protein